MDVTQRRSLNGLNYSNKNTMNFFTNTLDPMIALTLIAVLEIFLFLLVGAWTDQKVFTMDESEIKLSLIHI